MHDRHPTRQIHGSELLCPPLGVLAITPGRVLRFVVAVAKDRCPPSAREVTQLLVGPLLELFPGRWLPPSVSKSANPGAAVAGSTDGGS
jgi:hypothetical protein